nr:immunoglobulin heavy chain junction region [Homo sapiens]
CASLLEPAW